MTTGLSYSAQVKLFSTMESSGREAEQGCVTVGALKWIFPKKYTSNSLQRFLYSDFMNEKDTFIQLRVPLNIYLYFWDILHQYSDGNF